ncbi:hypothetical protein CRUP_022457 [Coryphaenoides rupestris]|nr:hypothetical protein CRUP_022457 [Coryphaenoides rupestris]
MEGTLPRTRVCYHMLGRGGLNVKSSSHANHGFISQPKIPRTPDHEAGVAQRSGRPGRGPPLAPQFSHSDPRPSSRPRSASDRGERPGESSRLVCLGHSGAPPSQEVREEEKKKENRRRRKRRVDLSAGSGPVSLGPTSRFL